MLRLSADNDFIPLLSINASSSSETLVLSFLCETDLCYPSCGTKALAYLALALIFQGETLIPTENCCDFQHSH
jgi:hypothetical protein